VMSGLDWVCDVWIREWVRECDEWIRVVVNVIGGLVNMMCGLESGLVNVVRGVVSMMSGFESGFVNVMSGLDRECDV